MQGDGNTPRTRQRRTERRRGMQEPAVGAGKPVQSTGGQPATPPDTGRTPPMQDPAGGRATDGVRTSTRGASGNQPLSGQSGRFGVTPGGFATGSNIRQMNGQNPGFRPQSNPGNPQGWQQRAYNAPENWGGQPGQVPPYGGQTYQQQNYPRQPYPPQPYPPQHAAPPQGFGPYGPGMQGGATGGQMMGGSGYRPPVPPAGAAKPPAGKGGRGGNGGKRGSMGSRIMMWVAIVLVVAVLGASAVIGGAHIKEQNDLHAAVTAYNSLYCPGVYVDGIHLGGMSQQEAAQAVMAHAQQRNDNWSVRLTYQGGLVTEITAAQLGMTVDVEDTLRQAWEQGHLGTVEERKAAMDQLAVTPYQGYTALPSGNTGVIDSMLTTLSAQVYTPPQDAYISTFTPGNTNPFTIVDEVPGRRLDTEPIKTRLYQMLATMESGSIEIVPEAIPAQVTADQLRPTVTLRATAYTEISTTSTDGRNNNIRRAFELISGTILKPGATFSFNNTVGERSTANGFYEAPEIVYNEMTTGIGGGVCQASTTLFQAAVKAGLTITDHTPHSEKANYTEYGLDATVYWYSNHRIDLKFQNNTEGNIYIVCSVQSNPSNRKRLIAKVDIYGMDMGGVKYDFVSEMIEELPYDTETKRDKNRNYVTYTDETFVKQAGRDGYVYQSYRVTLVNGKEVERVPLFKDTYKPRNEIVYVGTTTRPD